MDGPDCFKETGSSEAAVVTRTAILPSKPREQWYETYIILWCFQTHRKFQDKVVLRGVDRVGHSV